MFKTVGNSPGFCSKTADFRPLRNRPKSTQTVAERVKNHCSSFRRRFREFGAISSTFENPPCSKPWAIAQGFCSKTTDFRPLRNRPKSKQTVAERVKNHFEGFRRRFREFGAISSTFENPPCSKPWAIAQGFCSKTADFRPLRNRPKSTQTVAERVKNHFEGFRRRFREFGAISSTFENPPCSKPWAIAQGFCSKTADFRPLRNRPKSTQTVAERVKNHCSRFRRRFREFGAISSTFENPPCSKPWAIAQAFAQKRPISDHCEIARNRHKQSRRELKIIVQVSGGVSESLERFPVLSKIHHVQNHGL